MLIEQQIINRALDKGNVGVAKLLIDNITPTCLVNGDKLCIINRLMCHYSRHDIESIKVTQEQFFIDLIDKLQPKINNSFRNSCLIHHVAEWGHALSEDDLYIRLKILIDKGANIKKNAGITGMPALQQYLLYNSEYSDKIINLFLNNGADINAKDRDGNNVLLHGLINLYYNNVDNLLGDNFKTLINYGLNIRDVNNNNQSLIDAVNSKIEEVRTNYYYSRDRKKRDDVIKRLEELKVYYLTMTGGI